jgi:hypothetical protein
VDQCRLLSPQSRYLLRKCGLGILDVLHSLCGRADLPGEAERPIHALSRRNELHVTLALELCDPKHSSAEAPMSYDRLERATPDSPVPKALFLSSKTLVSAFA